MKKEQLDGSVNSLLLEDAGFFDEYSNAGGGMSADPYSAGIGAIGNVVTAALQRPRNLPKDDVKAVCGPMPRKFLGLSKKKRRARQKWDECAQKLGASVVMGRYDSQKPIIVNPTPSERKSEKPKATTSDKILAALAVSGVIGLIVFATVKLSRLSVNQAIHMP